MSKGSRPRPYSVSQKEFGNNYDAIFGKKDHMQVRVKEDTSKIGQCGCGRSQTGFCVGLHSLTPEEWANHVDNPAKPKKPRARKAPVEKPVVLKKPRVKKTPAN
jgi:CDGSH-type Zn-finger protein